jgi:O-methyltransferase
MPTSVKSMLEKSLKNTPFFGVAKWFFHTGRSILQTLEKGYLSFVNSILPINYTILKVPNYAIQDYKDYKLDINTYEKAWPYAQRDVVRIFTIQLLFREINKLSEGDYAELGTYRGSFARLIYKYMPDSAKLYCFDTFGGFDEKDVESESAISGDHVKAGFFSDTNVDNVVSYITSNDRKGDKNLVIRKGFFPPTYHGLEEKKWRFVLLDADLYEPQKAGLEIFWDRMVRGGILMIHDYNASYAGSKIATDEFFKDKDINLIPLADNAGSVYVIKN